ncbi:2-hydroxyacid dehydrogenase [Aquimarina spongiae]|uniref:D-lactate dehydrogenase n=1 Tax=Aquimarina spongiae TaxID=570521 RepID=A0A1M6I923_9FLAO|nr:2-hydroxyacid dehydrogenase [Aquimarina spongiae]SHJ30886.1 D-lactate dehydrogenase [Aquimarina spongiae]
MKILIYSAKDFEIPFLEKANNEVHQVKYIPDRLTDQTAILALGFDAISIFSADDASSKVLGLLKDFGIKFIALRSTGYDNVNLAKAKKIGMKVANAAGYSPYAIAEHAVGLLLALNRKLILSNTQVQNFNFSLSNLVGFDLYQKTVGIIGMGRIGKTIAKIMNGFGCQIIAFDPNKDLDFAEQFNVEYLDLEQVYHHSDMIFLSTPLTSQTHYLIDQKAIEQMKREVVLINVARGAVVHTKELIEALSAKRLKAYGTDVYEFENGLFFYDHSQNTSKDELLQKLLSFPNVLITPHQAFATHEALTNIAETTFYNINSWVENKTPENELTVELVG